MSNYKIIETKEVKIYHFINIEHSKEKIALSIHHGEESLEVLLTPQKARELAEELIVRAVEIESMAKNENQT